MSHPEPLHSRETGVIAWFAGNPVAANLLMMSILILGIISGFGLRIEGFPLIDPTSITVNVNYSSGNARQAEEGIAIKIEEALQGVEGIKEIRSTSTADGATVTVERVSGYDLERLNSEVKNKVDGIYGFPVAAEKATISKQLWEENALWIDLYGDIDQHSLQQLTRQFELALLRLPAINKVTKSGWQTPEIAIEVDEMALQAHGLTLGELARRVGNESLSEVSGELRSADGVIRLKADRQRYRYQEFAELVVATHSDGSVTRLADIATITDGFEETPRILSRFQGKPAINLQVIVDRNSSILEVADAARQLSREWRDNGRLPAGVDIALWWDKSTFMVDRLTLLVKNGAIGILLVMAVLAVFLNLRVAFWVGMCLPVCFAGALLVMGESMLNLTLNDLTSFGFIIVLGILVDDAVVVGESIYSTRQARGDTLQSTIIGVKRIAVPTMFGVLTTVAAFYPLSLIKGELGQIFGQFALVAVVCLLFSLLESKLILPAHLANIDTRLRPQPQSNLLGRGFQQLQQRANDLLVWIDEHCYQPAVHRAIRYRYAALVVFLALFVLVVGMIPAGKVKMVFFPNIARDVIAINYTAEEGSGYGISHGLAYDIEALVDTLNAGWQQQMPDSSAVIARIQTQVLQDRQGSVVMELSPAAERMVAVAEVEQALREALVNVEGIRQLQVIASDGGFSDFELKLLADDRQQLQRGVDRLVAALDAMPAVNDIQNDFKAGQPQLVFELTAEGRARGMTMAGLARQIQQAFYGAEVQRLQRGKDEVKVRVRYPAAQRRDITVLQRARIRTPDGAIVPLSAVARMVSQPSVSEINRINGRLAATISADVDKTLMAPAEVLARLQQTVLTELQRREPGLEVLQGGETAQEEETKASMLTMFCLSLMLIYILLAVPLKSYWQPLLIMSVIPFGIVGAILGHWFSDLAISILSLNGILALSGVVVNNSLLLINRFNELRGAGEEVLSAIVSAGRHRFRAILLTSVTTYAGLASLLLETSEQAQYLIPAAASLAYGILFSTLITLVLVPVLLTITDDVRRRLGRQAADPAEPEPARMAS